jgi:hypothetical protein
MATKQRLIEVLTTAMEKPDIANALIQRVINELKKEWVGLTDEERIDVLHSGDKEGYLEYAKGIEAKLKEKNT